MYVMNNNNVRDAFYTLFGFVDIKKRKFGPTMDSYARRFIPVHRLLYAKNAPKSDLTDWPGATTV